MLIKDTFKDDKPFSREQKPLKWTTSLSSVFIIVLMYVDVPLLLLKSHTLLECGDSDLLMMKISLRHTCVHANGTYLAGSGHTALAGSGHTALAGAGG